MSKLEKRLWGYEYISDNGISYEVGEVTAEYNVIVDTFMDISNLFDGNVLIKDHLVDYVHGNLMCGDDSDFEDIKDFLDDRIARYENHERTVRFYRDFKDAVDTLYTCYIGFDDEKSEMTTKISMAILFQIAREDRK